MTPEAWATNLGALAAASYAGWQSYQAKKAAREGREETAPILEQTRDAAIEASARSLPTSNGFARHTAESLAQLLDGQVEIRATLESQGRTIERVVDRLDRHIDRANEPR